MVEFVIRLTDGTAEVIPGADAYSADGPLTTFFVTSGSQPVINAWAERVASFRTADIASIRRIDEAAGRRCDRVRDAAEPEPALAAS